MEMCISSFLSIALEALSISTHQQTVLQVVHHSRLESGLFGSLPWSSSTLGTIDKRRRIILMTWPRIWPARRLKCGTRMEGRTMVVIIFSRILYILHTMHVYIMWASPTAYTTTITTQYGIKILSPLELLTSRVLCTCTYYVSKTVRLSCITSGASQSKCRLRDLRSCPTR